MGEEQGNAAGQRALWPKLRPWIFLCTILLIAAYVLSRPAEMSRLTIDATTDVLNEHRMSVEQQLAAEQPDLPAAELRMRSVAATREHLQTPAFAQAAAERVRQYRDAFSDADGQPFLLHNDPYHYLRQAENLEQYGIVGTHRTGYAVGHIQRWRGIRNALLNKDPPADPVQYREYLISALQHRERIIRMRMSTVRVQQIQDPVVNAPIGTPVESSTLPHLIFAIHLATGIPIHAAAYWYPVLIGLATLGAMFALIRMLSNDYGAFFGALLLAIHPAFFAANEAGYADTNALILLCMALIGCLVILLLRTTRALVAGIASVSLGLTMWALAETWSGVVSMAAVLLLFAVLYCGAIAISQFKSRRYALLALLGVLIVTVPGMLRSNAIERAFIYLGFRAGDILPNPYPLIAELSDLPPAILLSVLGGIPILAIMLAAAAYLLWKLWKERSPIALFLACWLAVFVLPALRVRFFVFLLLPLATLTGMALGEYFAVLPRAIAERRKHQGGFLANAALLRGALGAVLVVILAVAFVPNLRAEMHAAIPLLTAATAQTAQKLNAETPTDAIMNAWWDAGYFYETLAERPTLTTGASPGDWKSYWLAHAYLGTNPTASMRFLRLLDCGGENMVMTIPNAQRTENIELIQELLAADEDTAIKRIMSHGGISASAQSSEHLRNRVGVNLDNAGWMVNALERTHCNPREAYFMLSEDLFRKLEIFETYQESAFDGSTPRITNRYALPPAPCARTGGSLRCGTYVVDLRTQRAYVDGEELPLRTLPEGSLVTRNEPVSGNALMLYRDVADGQVYAIELKAALFETVLGKLYFTENPFPAQFEPFSDFSGPYNGRTVTYRIVWPTEGTTAAHTAQ